eukprot:5933455-Amphidinium_carterae.1
MPFNTQFIKRLQSYEFSLATFLAFVSFFSLVRVQQRDLASVQSFAAQKDLWQPAPASWLRSRLVVRGLYS